MFRPGTPIPAAGTAGDPAAGAAMGQPRPAEDAGRPCAAERVRTLVESDASAVLAIPGAEPFEHVAGTPAARAVTEDGDVLLLVPGDSPAARAAAHAQDDDVVAVMEITDVAPVAIPHRIRGRAWVGGWLTCVRDQAEREAAVALLAERDAVAELLGVNDPAGTDGAWTLLRLEVGEASVDDLLGAEDVDAEEFADAGPDPFVRHEAELLQHLAASHGEMVRGLCGLLNRADGRRCRSREEAVLVALDRFGLRVRFFGRSDDADAPGRPAPPMFDARFDFPEPVGEMPALRRAVHRLFEGAAHS